ncbi:hypothetical protein [Paenibacillus sp. NPDC058071]
MLGRSDFHEAGTVFKEATDADLDVVKKAYSSGAEWTSPSYERPTALLR